GLGKPLKSILHGRPDIPIYLAAIGPKNVQLTAEIADGWLPIFFSPRHYDAVFRESVEAGFALAGGGKDVAPFDIAPSVMVAVDDDLDAARSRVKPTLALYIGGMGAREENFYFNLACRYGYEDAARRVQDLFLDRKKAEAAAAVPDALVDDVALCGPSARIAERLNIWQASPITTLNMIVLDDRALHVMGDLLL
ncbi:MAG: LLM class flavin-dependent oxidoreductase, partial [Chloroflexi bacterium]|nr:LLM class flavin-dependent oxidoreductase [Chloroflexota bacterium]